MSVVHTVPVPMAEQLSALNQGLASPVAEIVLTKEDRVVRARAFKGLALRDMADGATVTIPEIVRRHPNVDRKTWWHWLHGLEEAGLIARCEPEADAQAQRTVGFRITPAGLAELERMDRNPAPEADAPAAPKATLGLDEPLTDEQLALVDEVCGPLETPADPPREEAAPKPSSSRDREIAAQLRAAGYPVVAGEERIEFGLFDDGTLRIYDADLLVEIPPEAVRRLALLLGVPGALPS